MPNNQDIPQPTIERTTVSIHLEGECRADESPAQAVKRMAEELVEGEAEQVISVG